MLPFVRYKILLRFGIILYFVSQFLFLLLLMFYFFAEKTMFSFQTLLKAGVTFSLLTSYLQFSITVRVSMTLKRRTVQSLSNHKTARTFCVSQERGIVERRVWSKWSFPLVWSRGRGWEDWVRLGRKAKNTSKKYDRNWQRKIKEWKQERKKWQFRSLKAVEKLVLPNPFLLINNKAPKVLDAQVEYIP